MQAKIAPRCDSPNIILGEESPKLLGWGIWRGVEGNAEPLYKYLMSTEGGRKRKK